MHCAYCDGPIDREAGFLYLSTVKGTYVSSPKPLCSTDCLLMIAERERQAAFDALDAEAKR